MRSSDIAARCREIALRVDASGEWGELGDTLREAAAEVERLRVQDHELRTLGVAEVVLRNDGLKGTADDIAAIAARLEGGE